MESWSYIAVGKESASEEVISDSDSFGRSKDGLISWDFKTNCSLGNNMFISSKQSMETLGFGDFGPVQGLIGEQVATDPNVNTFRARGCSSRDVTPVIDSANAFSGEEESTSKFSGSVVESNSRDSPRIDLKLGGIVDDRGARILSSLESSTPLKRTRATNLNSQSAFCQVYGCNKDLGSSKEYHKRHRVCEIHSKTPKVIVNGVEQRFCQQCSRFHLLPEFDDGKRSCRKRLAGHNERRRKPHVGTHSARAMGLLQSYNGKGSHFRGTVSLPTSFMPHSMLRSVLQPQNYRTNDWSKRVKFENGVNPVTFTNGHPSSEPDDFGTLFPSINGSGANLRTSQDDSSGYPHSIARVNSGSCDLLWETSLRSEQLGFSDTASTVQDLSGISDSGCALSLLSSRSHDSPSHYSLSRVSRKVEGLRSRVSTSQVLDNHIFSVENSSQGSYSDPVLISNNDSVPGFGIADGIYRSSDFSKPGNHIFCDDDSTIDLLQLSSQLQRVEHQRSMKNPETDAFCGLRIT